MTGSCQIGVGSPVPRSCGGSSAAALAISLGGVLLAGFALRRFADGLSQLSGAAIAWSEARPLFHAAADRPMTPAISDVARIRTRT